jgi:hypothetical protein
MASEPAAPAARAYPYWAGVHAACCSVVFFGAIGAIGTSFLPAGLERVREGQLPTGVAMMVLGAFGVPTLALALWYFLRAWFDAFRPPLLRLTPTALELPREARGEPPRDEYDQPTSTELPHPETVPLSAIRRAKCDGPERNRVLELVHDRSAEPLQLREHMMRAADFAELLAALRAAVPAAFSG